MPKPNDAQDLPQGVELILNQTGQYVPSLALVNLLVNARRNYY
jgi:hypothetical protein